MNSHFGKQAAWLSLIALGLLTWAGCGGQSHEALADTSMKYMDEMADILTSVKDEASAKAAVGKLESLAASVKELADKTKALGEPPADIKAKIEEKMKAKQAEIQEKMKTFFANISSNPALMTIIAPAMQKFEQIRGE